MNIKSHFPFHALQFNYYNLSLQMHRSVPELQLYYNNH